MKDHLICPHTSTALRPLSEDELQNLHQRVQKGELFFQRGVQLEFLPQSAYISQNQVCIYLEINGVILLQKQTAIVTKNRTADPLRRVVESDANDFYQSLGLNRDGSFMKVEHSAESELVPDPEASSILNQTLHKSGNCFLTLGSAQVDAMHNLLFNREFKQYVHVDHNMARLRAVISKLKQDTLYVLADHDSLPLSNASVDLMFSYDFVNDCDADQQKKLYESLKKVLSPEAKSVVLYEGNKPLILQKRYKSDVLGSKTKSYLTPWKKVQMPEIIFHRVELPSGASSGAFSGKTSFGSQLS